MEALAARGIRLVGIEGIEPDAVGVDLPPLLAGGRTVADGIVASEPTRTRRRRPSRPRCCSTSRCGRASRWCSRAATSPSSAASASGAEVVAGGSIHVYGTLRGRAVAGMSGNAAARIFCRRLEAELLAIDGLYRTADDIEAHLRGKPAQAWLSGDSMIVAGLD